MLMKDPNPPDNLVDSIFMAVRMRSATSSLHCARG